MVPFMEPLWGLAWLLFVLGGNLAVDWLVTALALRWQKIPNVKKKSLAVLLRVWLAGFAGRFCRRFFKLANVACGNADR